MDDAEEDLGQPLVTLSLGEGLLPASGLQRPGAAALDWDAKKARPSVLHGRMQCAASGQQAC